MELVLNILVALVVGAIAKYVATEFEMSHGVALGIGVVVGITVFLAGPAGYILTR